MAKPFARGMLLAAVAFAVKAALAQQAPPQDTPRENAQETPDVAAPGGLVVLDEAVVEGQKAPDVQQATTQVVSVLSSEDIARTGEGDVAGALSHVPGLSVVGGGFVYVRGLGDRYSLALLNGSPLPSPEPLRRAVPLDLFPTDVIASSLVQKTYSPNYTGEFGGGVINLTTLAIPLMPFLKISAGISGNTATTGGTGYDHFGSKYDWTGFDGGARDVPPALADFFASGQRMSQINNTDLEGHNASSDIAKEFVGPNNAIVQQIDEMAPNYSGSLTGGTSWMLGDMQLGIVGTAGYSNDWRTRDNLEQSPGSTDLSAVNKDYRRVSSENHLIANGLLGVSLESGPNQLRWTNLYVHDTLKRTEIARGTKQVSRPGAEFAEQGTGWYERELLSTQLAGTLDLDPVTLNARASYSKSNRDAPYELNIGYTRTNRGDYGDYFINHLDNGATGFARIGFSDLSEDLTSAGADLNWRVAPGVVLSTGYDYAYTARESARRVFQMLAPTSMPLGIGLLRPELLLAPAVIEYYDIHLVEETESAPAFDARMLTHGAYGQVQAQLAEGLELAIGARYERGKQIVRPRQVFATGSTSGASTRLEEDYILPAATLTWKFGDGQNQQLRFNVSETIARPQFRELMFQGYFDPEANRQYLGNPLLSDSKFRNAEARYEWYFAPEQRFSLAGFYKRIDKPIEAFVSFDSDGTPTVRYANAPRANLYGGELEWQKYVALDSLGERDGGLLNGFLAARRMVLISNYTFTTSKIKVKADDLTNVYIGDGLDPAISSSLLFTNGAHLTGQSDHIVNLQLGLEAPNHLSQQTVVFSYASDRVTSRGGGCSGGFCQPDIKESPGVRLDFVVRQGVELFGQELEMKFEARNLLGRGYREFQRSGDNVVYYNKYDVGRSYSASLSLNF